MEAFNSLHLVKLKIIMKNITLLFSLLFLLASTQSWGQSNCVSGNCKNGKGILKYSNAKYEGAFWNGKKHGYGVMHYPNGTRYEGNWAFNLPEGEGTRFYANGEKDKGYWEKGKFLGETLPEQTAIVGEVIPLSEEELAAKGVVQDNETIDLASISSTKIYAVVVGVSKYTSMPALNYTDDDAEQVHKFLQSPEGGALPASQLRLVMDEDATRDNIIAVMRDVYKDADEDDVIMLYFSGHGLKGAFLPIDYKNKQNKLEHSAVQEVFDESPAKFKVVIADACHSGSMGKTRGMRSVAATIKAYYDAFQGIDGGTALLLSSKAEEISLESNGLKQGIFSHFLIRGLKGEADSNLDKVVSIRELYKFVSMNVTDFTGAYQTPVIGGDYDDKMPVGVVR